MSYKSDVPCVACGFYDEDCVTFHHVYTRKAYPEYSEKVFNMMPLCLRCHVEIHKIGTGRMADKRPGVKIWLINNGWEFCDFRKKWTHLKE